ncbi:response regulator transcription factor [Geobacter sulfurreducens subsp. ethanolicus]|uniref:response regulator n=1 Tax=Geobacter sulfurreducens TaxID=35554 RepID=UPI00257358A3|nr:response regulator transcription factor [Geobacter sulfurreducens]BEH11744.1 response regulator transcription factor [Geobacter sulfurreducens subsp. ethanolicus]
MYAKKRVMIVDDHPLFRDGLRGLVSRSADYQAVGEAGSGTEALRQMEKCRPDLITMDISLPDMSGIDAAREIHRMAPHVKILMVSMHPRYEFIADAFKAGASGYVVKEATSARLIQAMDALSRGEFFLDGQVSQEVVQRIFSGSQADGGGSADERYTLLTPREQQVMRMIVEGATSRQIAESLDLTLKTVENHRTNLMRKLQVHNKLELVRYAARLGLIDLESWRGNEQ